MMIAECVKGRQSLRRQLAKVRRANHLYNGRQIARRAENLPCRALAEFFPGNAPSSNRSAEPVNKCRLDARPRSSVRDDKADDRAWSLVLVTN